MSALITQSLDENLKILLIAKPTNLAHLLVNKIQQQAAVKVELISPLEFSEADYDHQSWYKVVLLFEHSLIQNPSLIDQLCFLPRKSVVIMPLTTTVVAEKEAALSWGKQSKKELLLFNSLVKNIDVSRFIFYTDLISRDLGPTEMFFSQLQRNLLIDPNIELSLQTADGLIPILTTSLLRPLKETKIVSGKARLSGNYLQALKQLYFSHHQVNLPIKRVQLRLAEHPVLSVVSKSVELEENIEKVELISKEIMKSSMDGERKRDYSTKEDQQKPLTPPLKKNLIKDWNKVEVAPKNISLDLEHDLGVEPESAKTEMELNREQPPKLINSLFKEYRSQQKQAHIKKLTKSTRVGFRKLKNQKFLFGGGILISLAALGILASVVIFFTNLSQAQGSLLSYLESSSLPATAQQKKLVELETTVDQLNNKLALINKWFSTPFFSEAGQLIDISQYVVDLSNQSEGLEKETAAFFQRIMDQNEAGSLESVNEQSIEVFKTLSLLSAELKNYSPKKLSPEQSQLISDYRDLIKDEEKKINQYQQLSPLLPELLAQDEDKTYALILQNNQELRPTGGFIQAVALLTFKQGSLINFQVEDVYTLDQQLKANLTPPPEITKFLGEERWFLRDSNWNPSFPKTATRIKWFLEKSIGVRVDGVIGTNLKVLEEIIDVLNQVELDEYNEVLTKRNLNERMEFHSEVQLVESTKTKDYSELVLFKILNKIQQLPAEQVAPLLSSLVKMADSKEFLISIFDEDLKATFESLGWDGSLVEPACPTVFDRGECLVDSLMQVEANVGVNKANYYLERQIDHIISINSQEVSHKRVITFKNKAQTNAWPKGPYKSYVRFYIPENAEFKDIKINDQSVDSKQLTIKNELDRKVLGVLIEVAVTSELKLQLEYSLPHEYQTPFTYAFFDQKQPGARDISPRIFLHHEPDLSPALIAPQAEVQGDVIVFNPSKDDGHMFVGVSFE